MGDCMKKRGFTLIELLAVFTIMGIILLLSIPQITSLLKKSNDTSYESFLKNVSLACEAYVEDIGYNNIPTKTITIKTLVDNGYLKRTITNPKNNRPISDNVNMKKEIKINKDSENILICKLQED